MKPKRIEILPKHIRLLLFITFELGIVAIVTVFWDGWLAILIGTTVWFIVIVGIDVLLKKRRKHGK